MSNEDSRARNGADLFVECLVAEGVTHVFGVPGEETLELLDALRRSEIAFVPTRHEQHAAFMAANLGRLTGRAGACLSTLGPGATNLVTGVAYAQLGGMPLVTISGQKPLRGNLQGNFQLIDVIGMMNPLTKWAHQIASVDRIARSVRHAWQTAGEERPGAVHLELPQDIAAEDASDHVAQRPAYRRRPVADAAALDEAARAILAAEHPIVLISSGANRKRVSAELHGFLERSALFGLTTQMGKGVLDEGHAHSLFALGIHREDHAHAALKQADLVLTVGYDVVEYPPAVWNGKRDKHIVHLDFRPAEPDAYYAPEIEVTGDIATALRELGDRLAGKREVDGRLEKLRTLVAEQLFHAECERCHPPTPRSIVYDVRRIMSYNDVVCLDNGMYKIWFARLYQARAENTLLLDNALATMGAGLATAMAAKLADPSRRVLAVVGDGGFLMNLQDLETAVRMEQDLVVLVLRDDQYGMIRWKQEDDGFPQFGLSFSNPDFVRLAEAFGASGRRLEPGEDLGDVLEAAFTGGGVALVECPIDYTANEELDEPISDAIQALLSSGDQ